MKLTYVLLQYTYQKMNEGYKPNSTKEEIEDFLYYFEQFISISSDIQNIADIKKLFDGKSLVSNDNFLVIPTYEFTEDDLGYLKKMSQNQAKELEIAISSYLTKLPKRSYNNDVYTKEEIEFAKHSSALIIEFIWNNYIDAYIEIGKWPIQCRDINKYLFENDLASIIEVPSIRDKVLSFYAETTEKILTLRKENPNFKISEITNSLLAKTNSSFITSGYEELFEYCKKRTIEIDGETNTFTNRARADGVYVHENIIYSDISLRKEKIGSAKTKKMIETINNL